MRAEWRCASITSGGQCVMTAGAPLMLLWSADSWDMHTLEVSETLLNVSGCKYVFISGSSILQLGLHIAMRTLVLVLAPSSWMMSSVLQVLTSYWSVPVDQS